MLSLLLLFVVLVVKMTVVVVAAVSLPLLFLLYFAFLHSDLLGFLAHFPYFSYDPPSGSTNDRRGGESQNCGSSESGSCQEGGTARQIPRQDAKVQSVVDDGATSLSTTGSGGSQLFLLMSTTCCFCSSFRGKKRLS